MVHVRWQNGGTLRGFRLDNFAFVHGTTYVEMLKLGDLPNNNHFITLQIDGQSPNLFYSNYITKMEKSVASNDITN